MKRIGIDAHGFSARVLHIALAASGLSAASAPARAGDLYFPPALVSAPADAPKPKQPPLSVFGDNIPDPEKATFSIIPTFANFSHMMVGTHGVTSQQVVNSVG